MNLPDIKLKQDVPTRWNSTLDMIKRFIQLKDAIVSTVAVIQTERGEQNTGNLLSHSFLANDWNLLNELIKVFTIFDEITVEMSSEKHITLSKILVFVKIIMSKLNSLAEADLLPEIKNVISRLINDCKGRFANYKSNDLLAQSTILDPRFKKLGFQDIRKYENALQVLKTKVSQLFPKESNSGQNLQKETTDTDDNESDVWDEFEKEARLLCASGEPVARGIIEVDKYIAEMLVRRKDDPIKFWIDRKNIYPGLYEMMKRRLCIPGTSVPCERIFSKAGALITLKRNRLTGSKVGKIMFLKCNAKYIK